MYKMLLNGKNSGTGDVGHSIWHPYHGEAPPPRLENLFVNLPLFPERLPWPALQRESRQVSQAPPVGHDTSTGQSKCFHLGHALNRLHPGSVSSGHEPLPEGQELGSGDSIQSPWSAWSDTSPGLMTGSLPTAAPQYDLEHCSLPGFAAPKSDFWSSWRLSFRGSHNNSFRWITAPVVFWNSELGLTHTAWIHEGTVGFHVEICDISKMLALARDAQMAVKNLPANAGDAGSIPGLGRSPGEGNGNPLQYSCLKNLMDREAWWTTVHGVAKSWTRLSTHPLWNPSWVPGGGCAKAF